MRADLKSIIERMSVQSQGETEYKCKTCRDRGYITEIRDGYETAIPCKCLAKKEMVEKLNRSGLTEVFRRKTIKSFKANTDWQIKAKKKAIDYCKSFQENNAGIILTGQAGAGKTHLAIGIMLNLIEQNVGCVYKEYTEMLVNLKQSYMDNTNYIRELEQYLNPRVLFLDDFLKGNPSDADLKYIYTVINKRYLKKMPVIISTEKSLNDILSYDEAIGGRLFEIAQGNVIEFPRGAKNDMRLKGMI